MLLLHKAAVLSTAMTNNRFLKLSNSALQVVSGKNYVLYRKVIWKIKFYFIEGGGGGGVMKNVALTFSVPKSIYEWPLIQPIVC